MALETDELGPGWDGVQPPPKGGGKRTNDGPSLFMRLEPREEPYHIRLACTPIRFRKHRWAFRLLKQWPISPATDPSEKDADIAWKVGRFMPVTRYAAFVFDRDADNRLRILEESGDVFGPIGNHAHATKVNAASPTKGWDWIVLVEENVDATGRKTRSYKVTIDTSKNGPTPFTEAEIKALDNPKFQREELETKYFVKSTSEEINDLWEQLPESSRTNEQNDGGKGGKKGSNDSTRQTRQASEPPAEKAAVNTSAETSKSAPEKAAETASSVSNIEQPKDDDFLNDPLVGETSDDDDQPARLF